MRNAPDENPAAAPPERVHHKFSPSKLGNFEACPCWAGTDETNEAAARGTLQHAGYEGGGTEEALKLLSDPEAEEVIMCLEYTETVKNELEVEEKAAGGDSVQIFTETYVAVDDAHTTAGYLDRALVAPCAGKMAVLDCKFGKWPVESAETNPQGIAYMLGMLRECHARSWFGIKSASVHFMQPKLDTIDVATFQASQFNDLLLRIKTIVERARIAHASGVFDSATPKCINCLFCGNIGRCPKVAEIALNISKKYLPMEIPAECADVSPAKLADPKTAGYLLPIAAIAKKWAESYRGAVTVKAIDDPNFMPAGYRLISTEELEIDNEENLISAITNWARLNGVDDSDIRAAGRRYVLTPMQDYIKDHSKRGTKEKQVQSFREFLVEAKAARFVPGRTYLQAEGEDAPEKSKSKKK